MKETEMRFNMDLLVRPEFPYILRGQPPLTFPGGEDAVGEDLSNLDGVITDGDVRVRFALRRTDMRTEGVLRSELIAHDICSHQLVEGLVRHVFEQFDHRQTALTETGYDERT